MTPLDPAHRLSANAEASRDALLHLTSLDGLENPGVPLLAQPHVLPPSIDLRESRIGSLALDAEVGARQPQNGLDIFTVEEDEREPLPPMRLLLLRANGTEAKAIPNLLEYVEFAVGEDDSDPIAGALDVPLAVKEAGERWADAHGIPIERYPADWTKYGRGAGPLRNREMAEKADAALVIWDGVSRGSKSMIREA